ncbi:hypothetical protein [Flavonifractor plautii]|uniref:hypothetical protein n=1 Tax=Flavonifractor plautii TaxID=292800 RepID=UPI003EEB5317
MRDGYVRRIAENALGALVSAVGIAMMLQANVGLEPWSVLQEGMSNTMGITYGTASILVGAVIIAVSLLCGEPIGLGTVLNIVLCAVFIDGIQAMGWIPRWTRCGGAYSCWRPGWRSWSSAPGSICAPPWVPAPGTR